MKRAAAWVLRLAIAVAAALGVWGWWLDLGPSMDDPLRRLWLSLYQTIQMFFANVGYDRGPLPWQLMVAAFLAPLALASAFILALYRSGRAWVTGLFVRLFLRRPVIVAGTRPEARVFLRKSPPGKRVVVLADPDDADQKRHVYLSGSPFSPRTWKRAGLARASAVLVFPADGEELWGIPRAIAHGGARSHSKTPLKVVMAFQDDGRQELLAALKDAFPSRRGIEIVTTSLQHSAAAELAELIAPHTTQGRSSLFTCAPHLLVEGWSPFVRELLFETAQLYHYPAPGKLELSVVTDDAVEVPSGLRKVVELRTLTPRELCAVQDGSQAPQWANAPSVVLLAPGSPWSIPLSARRWKRFQVLSSPTTPLAIHALVSERDTGEAERDVLARSCAGLGLEIHLLEGFIDWKHLVTNTHVIDSIASRIHGRYAALYGAPPWESLTEREREFNRRSARHLKIKLWCLGYRLEEGRSEGDLGLADPAPEVREMLARLEHRRWQAEKLLDDFLPGPSSEDPATRGFWKASLRIHPDIRPFEELSAFDVSKDENTFADMKEILKLLQPTHRLVRDPGA